MHGDNVQLFTQTLYCSVLILILAKADVTSKIPTSQLGGELKMKPMLSAAAFLFLGLCLGYFMHTPTAHAQTPKQSQLGPDAEVVPQSELVEEIKPGEWVPNFKGKMRAVSLSCVSGGNGEKCYVLLQSN